MIELAVGGLKQCYDAETPRPLKRTGYDHLDVFPPTQALQPGLGLPSQGWGCELQQGNPTPGPFTRRGLDVSIGVFGETSIRIETATDVRVVSRIAAENVDVAGLRHAWGPY